jgi:molecular chaperone GrpE
MTSSDPPSKDEANANDASETNGHAIRPSSEESETREASADPLAEARAEGVRLKDQWMRVAADFDNYRKRARRDVEDSRKGGREELLKDLLPVFDNLERAVHSAQRAQDVKAVVDGLSMVLRQFTEVLGRVGIVKVPTTGSAFDPTVHEAIQQIETDDHPAGTVVAEVQPGYVHADRLLRAAMVVVAKPKARTAPENPE